MPWSRHWESQVVAQTLVTKTDYEEVYCRGVMKHFSKTMTRVDVVFDHYLKGYIKFATHQERGKLKKPTASDTTSSLANATYSQNIHSFWKALAVMVHMKQRRSFCVQHPTEQVSWWSQKWYILKGEKGLELLPPTSNALSFHISHANYQVKISLQSDKGSPAFELAWKTDS